MRLPVVLVPRSCPLPVLSFLVVTAVLLRAEGPSAGELQLRDRGTLRRFEVAADELEVRWPKPRTERLRPVNGLDDLRARARLRTATGEETCLVLYAVGAARSKASRRVLTRDVAVRLRLGADVGQALETLPGAVNHGELTFAPGWFRVTAEDPAGAPALERALRARREVLDTELQLGRHYQPELTPNDTYFASQWHLLATPANSGANAGNDLQVTSVWDTYRGAGIVIGILDSGVQFSHPDLSANLDASLSHDFADGDADANPAGLSLEEHGTSVAGLAAARGDNGRGVAGVAYEADLAVHRLIVDAPITDLQVAEAFAHRTDAISIKNNSWGQPTYGTNLHPIGGLLDATLRQTVETGRGGRGTLHVFSAGNQGEAGDNVNYDQLKSSIYCIAVAAISQDGAAEPYSNPGAALVVGAPGGAPADPQILTADLVGGFYGYNRINSTGDLSDRDYTRQFAGTSAAAPMVSGVVALMLQANPSLGWRDVQEILMRSATQNAPADPGWAINSAGLKFHHRFGGGLANASNAVALATSWVNLAPATQRTVAANDLALPIPDGDPEGVTVPLPFTHDDLRVEHVRLRLDADHSRRGDLVVTLTSPGGMESRLAELRNDPGPNYKGWTFTSRAHWGERASGTWTLRVADASPGDTGTLLAARLEVLGTFADPVRIETTACTEVPGRSNGNGYPDAGETVRETIRLLNTTSGPLAGLTATLSSATPGVTVLTADSPFPVLPAGGSALNEVPFEVRLAKDLCGSEVAFTLVTATPTGPVTHTFSQLVGRPVDDSPLTQNHPSTDVPQAVPDITTAYSTLSVPALPGHVLDDLNVSLRIDHTAIVDLQLAIRHPDGTEVILADHAGGNDPDYGAGTCGVDVTPTIFDDAASQAISAGDAPFAASFRPEEPLSALAGKPPGGEWRLRVSDAYDGDSGTLHCWSLEAVSHRRTVACEVYNVPPAALPLALTVPEGGVTNGVLPGADGDGDPLLFFTNSAPQHGVLRSFEPGTGAFTYASTPGYSGPDGFTFTVSDGFTNSARETVSITILPASADVTLAQPAFNPSAGFQARAAGPPDQDYFLEATADFGQWEVLWTNRPTASPFWLADPEATNRPHRFYRLRF